MTASSGNKLSCKCVTKPGEHFTQTHGLLPEKLVIISSSRKRTSEVIGHLIEEHILPVSPFRCKLLDDPLRADAMLGTQLLPELKTDCSQTGEATVVYIFNNVQ